MTETTTPKTMNRLNAKQLYQLCERMKVDYVSSRLDDKQYGLMLTTEPGWAFVVNRFNVATARDMLELTANTVTIANERKAEKAAAVSGKACDHTLILDELATLQSMVAALSKQIHQLGAKQ